MNRHLNPIVVVAFLVVSSVTAVVGQSSGAKVAGGGHNGNAHAAPAAISISLPVRKDSVKFVIIGDTGTGTEKQHELADILLRSRQSFPYEFVLMMGDNMYGGEKPTDYKLKFEDVYRPILDQKVKFYATLGNHDEPAQRFYEFFNMEGKEYYRFTRGNVAFYCLNSNYMDKKQVDWLESELAKDTSEWKIAFAHHPPYSSGGKHGSETQLREVMSFMLVEISNNQMFFQVISRTGATVDSGTVVSTRKKS